MRGASGTDDEPNWRCWTSRAQLIDDVEDWRSSEIYGIPKEQRNSLEILAKVKWVLRAIAEIELKIYLRKI